MDLARRQGEPRVRCRHLQYSATSSKAATFKRALRHAETYEHLHPNMQDKPGGAYISCKAKQHIKEEIFQNDLTKEDMFEEMSIITEVRYFLFCSNFMKLTICFNLLERH